MRNRDRQRKYRRKNRNEIIVMRYNVDIKETTSLGNDRNQ